MKDIMNNNLTVEEIDIEAVISEPDIFCFACGVTFSFLHGCQCETALLENWIIKPFVIDHTLWFTGNTCVISSFDGSFEIMAYKPFQCQS